ncbi:MAG: oligosaccharide flippase family protein [Nitrospirae bacterium]|nr:oligosaccharide flippase family protein [Nitrospirota bacterium]
MSPPAADARILAQGSATNLFGILLRCTRVGFLWVVASLYGTTVYAHYTLSFAVFDFLLFVCLAGFDNALWNFIPRYRGRDPEQERACLRTALGLPLIASLVLGAALFVSAPFIADSFFRKPEVAAGLRWMAVILPPAVTARMLYAATRGLKIMAYFVIGIEFLEPVVMLIVSLAVLGLAGSAPWASAGPYAAHLAAEAVVLLVGLAFFARHFSLRTLSLRGGGCLDGETLRFAVALGGVNVSALLARRVDIFLVGRYLPVAQVAAYNLATELAYLLAKIRAAFTPIVTPLMAEASSSGDLDRLRRSTRLSTLWGTAGALPALVLYVIFGAWLIELFGMDGKVGYTALVLLSAGSFLNLAAGPTGEVLAATGRPFAYTLFNSIPIAMVAALGPLCIPVAGTWAAGALAGGGNALSKVPQAWMTWRRIGVHGFSRRQARVLAAGLALGAGTWGAAALLPGTGPAEVLGLSTLFVAAYAGWLWRKKLLRPEC